MKHPILIIVTAIIITFTTTVPAFALTSAEQTRLTNIITKGSQEIDRRVSALNAASTVIDKTEKLAAGDRQMLNAEVASSISGLSTLKTKLSAETTLGAARTDAQSILTGYRVYALLLPKVRLVKVADGQIALEAKFTALSAKFLERFAELKAAGRDTVSLEATLSTMNTKVTDAEAISTAIQAKVIALQPSDYNADHTILSGDRDQLKVAHDKLVSARKDAKTIVDGIKSLAA
ncbi:MAG: hypothetical protein ABIP74_04985 [Candidatus Saccharimonas sp.]